MSEKRLYVIMTAKKIHCLNHITGPVTTPIEMNIGDVLSLVKQGFDVYEVNPYNKKERVKVTQTNYNSITFKTSYYDMIQRKRLNRELQSIDKDTKSTVTESVKKDESKKEEPKKDDGKKEEIKKKEPEKKVDVDDVKAEKPSHTDFQKH